MKTPDKGSLDEWLDKALQQYGNAEPGIGLENRILANLEAAGKRAHRGYGWLLAGASVAVLVMATGNEIWRQALHPRRDAPALAARQNAVKEVSPAMAPQTKPVARSRRSRPRRRAFAGSQVASTNTPRLGQFPSPLPLSQQELSMASYAEHFPKEALLIVQQQRVFEEETRLAEQDARGNASAVPDQER